MQQLSTDRTNSSTGSSPCKLVRLLPALILSLASLPALAQDAAPSVDEAGAARTSTADRTARKPMHRVKQGIDPHKVDPVAPTSSTVAAVPATPALKICVINRQSIIRQADINVASSKRLSELRQQAQEEIAKGQQVLQTDLKVINAEKRAPNDETLKKEIAALDVRVQALAAQADFKRRQIDMTRDIVDKQISTAAFPLLQEAEKEKSCTLLLTQESVIDGTGFIDITPVVMAAMNAQLHSLPFSLVELTPQKTAGATRAVTAPSK